VAAWSWANGFGELTDPVQQRARFESAMARRNGFYGTRYPLDEIFLDPWLLCHPPAEQPWVSTGW